MAVLRIEEQLNPSEETATAIAVLEQYFAKHAEPVCFRPVDGSNPIIENEKKFEKLCASFSEAGMQQAREMSMYDFRIRLEYFEEKAESFKSKTNNHADQ